MATNIVSEDTHLPRWAYLLLALLAGAIGLAASYVTAQFFILGLERTESDTLAREALIAAGILMIVVELAAFGLSALLPRERLQALRTRLIWTGIALVAFEVTTIYAVQVTLVRSSDAVHHGAAARIANLEASIAQNRRAAAALIATGTRSGDSQYASSRADGAQALREAARIEQRNAALSAELSKLQASQSPTLTSVLGENGMIWYSVARGVLIVGMGLVMFAAAGALLRAGRGVSVLPAPVAEPAAALSVNNYAIARSLAGMPTALPSAARRWAAAGVPLAAIPAAAFAAPSVTVTAPATAAPVLNRAHPGALKQAHLQTEEYTTKRTRRVRAGAQIDTGTEGRSAARYERIKTAVRAGDLKPSVRSIQAVEGGGTAVARRYLDQLAEEGVIVSIGRGRGYQLAGSA